MTQCQSVSTFESEVRNSLSALEPHSTDSLGNQHRAKKLSPKIALHFKVLCKSKATLLHILLERFRFSFDKKTNSNIEAGRQIGFCHYSVVLLVKSQRFLVSFLARNTYNYPGRYFVKVKALRSVTLDTAAVS